jgi:hypothetical protein
MFPGGGAGATGSTLAPSGGAVGTLDDFAPFQLGEEWLSTTLPTAMQSGGGGGAGTGAFGSDDAWVHRLRAVIRTVDLWSRHAALLVRRNANARVYGLLWLAAIHLYVLYSLVRAVVG